MRAQYRWADIHTYSHEDRSRSTVSGAGEIEGGGDVLLRGGRPPRPDADSWFVNAIDVRIRAPIRRA